MGLDMYILTDEGDQLAYWRKHPDLHGFIVQEFGGGVDECQRIPLSMDALQKVIDAVNADNLPHTEGFFFGASRADDRQPTLDKLVEVKRWLAENPGRHIYYQASW